MNKWIRVSGPDSDPWNLNRFRANLAIRLSEIFIEACKAAGVEPTQRQASKYRRKKGRVYGFNRENSG